MFSSNYYYSETVTTTTPAPRGKGRKIPVNGEPVENPSDFEEALRIPETPEQAAPESKAAEQENLAPETKPSSSPSQREQVLAGDIQRLQAEYVNYRKRVERDRDLARTQAVQSTFEKLLPVLDDISAARTYGELQDGPFASIAKKLEATVKELGFTVIDEPNVPFDPSIHEAVLVSDDENMPADYIIKVLRNGYTSGDKTIRAAQVMVSS